MMRKFDLYWFVWEVWRSEWGKKRWKPVRCVHTYYRKLFLQIDIGNLYLKIWPQKNGTFFRENTVFGASVHRSSNFMDGKPPMKPNLMGKLSRTWHCSFVFCSDLHILWWPPSEQTVKHPNSRALICCLSFLIVAALDICIPAKEERKRENEVWRHSVNARLP